ncbi:hypothetical protein M0802_006740 [Mischocyttarus mexicanus]|nr:hypothetical protein M0802_006740 [Mischocyttarus mexicanus]
MKNKLIVLFQVLAVLLLSVIPWPGPSVFKISCPRDRASVVRRIVHKRWIPILKKYQVELPLECPFHESRDIFRPQQRAKHQHRPSQWTCGLCGKSFYAEKHLDAHFDNRHKSNVNTAEDAVCLADYCDIMRCEVLGNRDFENSIDDEDDDGGHLNTDIQILVRDCIAGLLANLSVRDFQEIEGELNRAICWYLSCDKYWEDTKRQQRQTPWYLLATFMALFCTSIYACYYVIWVLFNTGDEERLDNLGNYNDRSLTGTSSLHDQSGHGEGRLMDRRKIDGEDDNLASTNEEMPDHYIYVAYPPELKRRLLERLVEKKCRILLPQLNRKT